MAMILMGLAPCVLILSVVIILYIKQRRNSMFCKRCGKPCMWNKDLCYEHRQEKIKADKEHKERQKENHV